MSAYKFRAWHKPTGSMLAWEALSKLIDGADIWIAPGVPMGARFTRRDAPDAIILRHGNPFANPDLIIMQTTELTDVDGREIYEGDHVINLTYHGSSHQDVIATMKRKNLLAGPAIVFEAEEMGIRHWIDARLLVIGNEFEKSTRKA